MYELTAQAEVAERIATMAADTPVAIRGTIHMHQWQTAGFTPRNQIELRADTIYRIEPWPPT